MTSPAIQVRFGPKVLNKGIQEHMIEGVSVRIYNPAKTVVDLFRYRQSAGRRCQKSPGLNLAIGLREAPQGDTVRDRAYATEAGIWSVVQPYLEAITANVSSRSRIWGRT